jgi:hypothetical protein
VFNQFAEQKTPLPEVQWGPSNASKNQLWTLTGRHNSSKHQLLAG